MVSSERDPLLPEMPQTPQTGPRYRHETHSCTDECNVIRTSTDMQSDYTVGVRLYASCLTPAMRLDFVRMMTRWMQSAIQGTPPPIELIIRAFGLPMVVEILRASLYNYYVNVENDPLPDPNAEENSRVDAFYLCLTRLQDEGVVCRPPQDVCSWLRELRPCGEICNADEFQDILFSFHCEEHWFVYFRCFW